MNRILRMGNAGWFSLLTLIVLTSGCGGGGGGGGGGVSSSGGNNTPATTYTGKTSQAVITQSNAKVLTAAGSDSGLLSSGAVGSGVRAKTVARTAKIAALAVSTAPETVNGSCGGNSVSGSTYDSATGKISGSTTYNSYCQGGTTENGQTTFSGTLSQANSSLDVTITFSSYSTKDATSDTLINGTAALKGTLLADGSISNATLIMNVESKDNIENVVMKMENVNVTFSVTSGYTEFTINSGRVYHPDYGYFDLSTPTAIRTNSGDVNPSSGVLVIAGANNSRAKLTYLSNTQYKVEADETGSGTYTLVGTYDWSGASSGAAAPAISAVTPASGAVGAQVAIAGANFSTTSASNFVKFNGTTATVTSATATQIVATVPVGATTGPVIVTTSGGTATSSSVFTVTTVGIKNELVSRSTNSSVFGTATNGEFPVISADGRFVAFVSYAANLAPGATGLKRQIFVHDRQAHVTELVSVNTAGIEGDNDCSAPAISSDGRYVVFTSYATNLVSGDANAVRDVFIRDRESQTTGRVSVGSGGVEGNSDSYEPAISVDGRYVAFTSYADNLTAGVTGNAKTNVYVRDMLTSTNTLVSMTLSGTGGSVGSGLPAISADGSRIAFYSIEDKLVVSDTNVNIWDIFLWDRNSSPKTKLVSVSSTGVAKNQGNESASRMVAPSISADGNFIAYSTTATNLVAGDTNGLQDVFVYKVSTGATSRASEGTGGVQATGDSPVGQGERVALSTDGTWVAFTTTAANISAGGSNVVIHNNASGETRALTADSGFFSGSKGPAISGDGRFVTFISSLKLDLRFASSGIFVQDLTLP